MKSKVYSLRATGREYCNNTEGSAHYKNNSVEPMDLIIAVGAAEGFCIGNMIKYSARFAKTQNLNDLKKVTDYAHILAGIKLEDSGGEEDAKRSTKISRACESKGPGATEYYNIEKKQ